MFGKRHLALGAAAVFAAAFGASAPVAAQQEVARPTAASTPQWQASDDDFLLLQLVIKSYKLTNDVRGYQTNSGVCLDLADVIQSLDLPIRLDKKSRRATGWLFAEDQAFTLDREANTVQNVNNGKAPVESDIFDTPEGWCVDTKALSRWFGLDFRPDLYNAVVRLETDRELPFMQAIERRSRAARLQGKRKTFDLAEFPQAEMEYKAWRTPSVDVTLRAGYRSGNSSRNGATGRAEVYVAGEALAASYFARLATDDQMVPSSLRFRAYRHDPDGGLLGPLRATQVAVGDVETNPGQLTVQTAVGRGAYVSNQPLGRQSRFSTTTLRGVLPAGWDAELYRNGQLIAFQEDDGDGRYEFLDVELFFGRNELEVVLYGPQGQIRRDRTDYPVGSNNIEPGQTHYWAGIVQDDRDLIELDPDPLSGPKRWRWGVGVERGLDERTSAALGIQSTSFNGSRRTYAEGSLSRTFGAMQLEMAAAHEFGEGFVAQTNALGRIGGTNLGASAVWTFGNYQSEFIAPDLDHRLGFQFDTSLKLGRFVLPLQGSASRAYLRSGAKVNEFLLQTSMRAGPIALSAQLQHQKQEGMATPAARDRTRLRLLANTRLKGLRLRGNATFDLAGVERGLDTAQITVEKNLDEVSDLNGEIEYLARDKETRFAVGYSRRFEGFSLRADANWRTDGVIGANVALAFSFGPDPRDGGLRFSQEKLARLGQASVTVFRDENGDGRRNPGEELIEDVGVEAGFRRTDAVTDEQGRALLDGLKPFKAVLVGIDEGSLSDPYLAPTTKGIVVVPRPGVSAQIELGITPSGEVEGVLLGLNGLEQPGVLLELVDRSGRVAATTISEFDGFFLFERVPYGEYSLRIASDAARKLQVERNLTNEIVVKRDADIMRAGALKLRGARPTVASAPTGAPTSGSGSDVVAAAGAQSPN